MACRHTMNETTIPLLFLGLKGGIGSGRAKERIITIYIRKEVVLLSTQSTLEFFLNVGRNPANSRAFHIIDSTHRLTNIASTWTIISLYRCWWRRQRISLRKSLNKTKSRQLQNFFKIVN
jgi:hypothetical protein